jgi:hypothetical protein
VNEPTRRIISETFPAFDSGTPCLGSEIGVLNVQPSKVRAPKDTRDVADASLAPPLTRPDQPLCREAHQLSPVRYTADPGSPHVSADSGHQGQPNPPNSRIIDVVEHSPTPSP